MVKLKTAALVVPALLIVALDPAAPVDTVPTVIVAADPARPVAPVAPVGPWGPVAPVDPVAPAGPWAPVGPVAPVDPCGPVAPVGPCGIVNANTTVWLVPVLVTLAADPGAPVVVEPTVTDTVPPPEPLLGAP